MEKNHSARPRNFWARMESASPFPATVIMAIAPQEYTVREGNTVARSATPGSGWTPSPGPANPTALGTKTSIIAMTIRHRKCLLLSRNLIGNTKTTYQGLVTNSGARMGLVELNLGREGNCSEQCMMATTSSWLEGRLARRMVWHTILSWMPGIGRSTNQPILVCQVWLVGLIVWR